MAKNGITQGISGTEQAAIYCRISKADEDDQTGVDRQEEICREVAKRLSFRVVDVYKDNNRSAWQRNRKRPGWDELLTKMGKGKYRHVIVYHPDRLMRQPRDLEELLAAAEDQRVTLHGQANRRDLSNADDRFILRIEVAQACKSSDDTSRRVSTALEHKAKAGDPHAGRRHYGYAPDRRSVVEDEAKIIREIYARYLDGETPLAIARILHARREKTAEGTDWQGNTVRNMLDSPFVAGVLIHRGKRIGMGTWPPIIDLGQWEEVQTLRSHRSVEEKERCAPRRYYTLRGVVVCTCGARMGGSSSSKTQYIYRCGRTARNGQARCKRTILAPALETLMKDLALRVLEKLDISGRPAPVTPRSPEDVRADQDDQQQLNELDGMWLAKEIATPTYRSMRRTIEDRIKDRQRVPVQRPVAVLEGVTGPNARAAWRKLEEQEDFARINAIFKFLYAAVIIKPTDKRGRGLDLSRIEVEPNPLP